MTEFMVNRWACYDRWKCYVFWLDEGIPYDRWGLKQDGYELTNSHTLLADGERGLLVEHDFEFTHGMRNGWMLVKAETPTEAWRIYDERSAA